MTTTKKCWSCVAITPYEQGWCEDCWNLIPPRVKVVAQAMSPEIGPEPYAGAIRLAIANTLRQQRRPPPTPRPKTKGLSLEDLDL